MIVHPSEHGFADLLPLLVRHNCRRLHFAAGQALRRKGHHYADMLVVAEGEVRPEPPAGNRRAPLGRGAPIGATAFASGRSSVETLLAAKSTTALVIDDQLLNAIEQDDAATARELHKGLAGAPAAAPLTAERVEILLCRTEAMLLAAKNLRYEVYCGELGRSSRNADHGSRTLSDHLDQSGHTFVARDDGETVGTVRVNFAWEGTLGGYEALYDGEAWRRFQGRAAVCTKLAVGSSSRSSDALLHLLAAALRYVIRHEAEACFIDSLPRFTPLYARLGFVSAGEPFMHHENGWSDRLVLELARYRGLISEDDPLGDLRRLLRNGEDAQQPPAG